MVHNLGKLGRRCGLLTGAAALCFTLVGSLLKAQAQLVDEPRYAPSGDLLLPNGFETWVFVGSNLGLSYTPEAAAAAAAPPPRAGRQQFHNVAINKAAYDFFLANGRFPDGTVLVMQVFEAADKEPKGVLAGGMFNGRRVGLEVAVKNASRPDGKTTPWAYYNFTDPSDRSKVLASAAAFPDEACANCHQRHASVDNVWVQFYPALRDGRQ
jgi:Cytochrome P460